MNKSFDIIIWRLVAFHLGLSILMYLFEQMLKDGDTEFVLVGAAYLVGSDGLLDLLNEKGNNAKQL